MAMVSTLNCNLKKNSILTPKGADNFGADCIFTKNIAYDFDIHLIPIFICYSFT